MSSNWKYIERPQNLFTSLAPHSPYHSLTLAFEPELVQHRMSHFLIWASSPWAISPRIPVLLSPFFVFWPYFGITNMTLKRTIPTPKMIVKTIAQMRSSTAAASIQSCFISFSRWCSLRCSSLLWIFVSRRSQSLFRSICTDSWSAVWPDGDATLPLLWLSPEAVVRLLLMLISGRDWDFGWLMHRQVANLLQKRVFSCNVKYAYFYVTE